MIYMIYDIYARYFNIVMSEYIGNVINCASWTQTEPKIQEYLVHNLWLVIVLFFAETIWKGKYKPKSHANTTAPCDITKTVFGHPVYGKRHRNKIKDWLFSNLTSILEPTLEHE